MTSDITAAPDPTEASFDPTDPEFRADPYPVYRKLRDAGPAHQGFFGVLTFVRYQECAALLRDPRFGKDFTKSKFYDLVLAATKGDPPPFLGFGIPGGTKPFMLTDPPDHTRLRALVSAPFTPSMVRGLAGFVEQIVAEVLPTLPSEFDLIEAVAKPVPVRLLGHLLGIPEQDFQQFTEWNHEIAGMLDLDLDIPPEDARRRRAAITDCIDYFLARVRERTGSPGADLVSALANVQDGDDKLSAYEVAATCALLMTAASETTLNLIGSGAHVFAREPESYARLAADPTLVDSAVDEVLRFEPPAHETGRIALEEIRVGDFVVEPGDPVLFMLASANRDDARFPDGDRFLIDRNDKGHLSFGLGIHYCMGAPLARMMAGIVFTALARRFSRIEVTVEAPPYRGGVGLRGPAELPVAVTRR